MKVYFERLDSGKVRARSGPMTVTVDTRGGQFWLASRLRRVADRLEPRDAQRREEYREALNELAEELHDGPAFMMSARTVVRRAIKERREAAARERRGTFTYTDGDMRPCPDCGGSGITRAMVMAAPLSDVVIPSEHCLRCGGSGVKPRREAVVDDGLKLARKMCAADLERERKQRERER